MNEKEQRIPQQVAELRAIVLETIQQQQNFIKTYSTVMRDDIETFSLTFTPLGGSTKTVDIPTFKRLIDLAATAQTSLHRLSEHLNFLAEFTGTTEDAISLHKYLPNMRDETATVVSLRALEELTANARIVKDGVPKLDKLIHEASQHAETVRTAFEQLEGSNKQIIDKLLRGTVLQHVTVSHLFRRRNFSTSVRGWVSTPVSIQITPKSMDSCILVRVNNIHTITPKSTVPSAIEYTFFRGRNDDTPVNIASDEDKNGRYAVVRQARDEGEQPIETRHIVSFSGVDARHQTNDVTTYIVHYRNVSDSPHVTLYQGSEDVLMEAIEINNKHLHKQISWWEQQ